MNTCFRVRGDEHHPGLDDSQKTEEPTPKKLRETTRNKGQVVQSKGEIGNFATLAGLALTVAVIARFFYSSCF